MYAVCNTCLKHVAQITDNLTGCVHLCVNYCPSQILFKFKSMANGFSIYLSQDTKKYLTMQL